MNELKSIYDNYKYIICLDTETTGLNPKTCQIIDLGVIVMENKDGEIKEVMQINSLIKLIDPFASLPKEIVELTHITDEMLKDKGEDINDVKRKFGDILSLPGKKLIATYNAEFDLSFLRYFLKGYKFQDLDFLDILTIYKDRADYPHKLYLAVTHYGLDDKVANTHRALDDTYACFEVLKAMSDESDDIIKYVNLFGYNAKFGVPKEQIKNVKYKAQSFERTVPLYMK